MRLFLQRCAAGTKLYYFEYLLWYKVPIWTNCIAFLLEHKAKFLMPSPQHRELYMTRRSPALLVYLNLLCISLPQFHPYDQYNIWRGKPSSSLVRLLSNSNVKVNVEIKRSQKQTYLFWIKIYDNSFIICKALFDAIGITIVPCFFSLFYENVHRTFLVWKGLARCRNFEANQSFLRCFCYRLILNTSYHFG